MPCWEVAPRESNIKLIAFLRAKLEAQFSSRQLKKIIEGDRCRINGRPERFASTVLGSGDVISIELEKISRTRDFIKPGTLYEDDDLLIIHKPAGISSESPRLLEEFPSEVKLIHRLDKNTTGVLILSKDSQAHEAMISLFRKKAIEKHYLAVVDGLPHARQGVIENFLGKLKIYQGQTIWGESIKGLYAKTRWICERKSNSAALLRCIPETGRTHQIRVHMSGMGHPILGDLQYGKRFQCSYQPNRHLLHALSVLFLHPFRKELIKVEAPIPNDFQEAVNRVFDS